MVPFGFPRAYSFRGSRSDEEVRVHLGLVERRPADPHVEECEPCQAASHAHVGTFHRLIAGAGSDVEWKEEADNKGDCGENGRANEEICRFC